MGKKRCIILLGLIFILIASVCSAAIIHGEIYDLGLNEVDNAIVEINTVPQQQKVAKNSTYTFNVHLGEYIITAKKYDGNELTSLTSEKINITKDGEYTIDLILFPNFGEEEQLIDDAEFNIEYLLVEEKPNYGGIFILLAALGVIWWYVLRRKKNENDSDNNSEEFTGNETEKVIAFIKKEGGRTTQKDIRKHFPQSEAKISLIITELEHKGKIKKIKKGRGNIIILNK